MEFTPVKLSDKARIEAILTPLARNDSALGFANIFGMQEKYGTRFCIHDNVLYLRQDARFSDETAYYLPLGTRDLVGDTEKLRVQAESLGPFRFVGITPEEMTALQKGGMRLAFTTDRAFAEYLYHTEKIAAYAGPDLAKKRREVRKFEKLYGGRMRIEPLTSHNLPQTMAYQQNWFEDNNSRNMPSEHSLELEHRKIRLDAEHFWELDLEGIILYIDDEPAGYAYGTLLPGGAFDVMVLKGTLNYRFIWRVILQELAKRVKGHAKLLNLEEDLGLAGLRENKESYQPCTLLQKYQALPSS